MVAEHFAQTMELFRKDLLNQTIFAVPAGQRIFQLRQNTGVGFQKRDRLVNRLGIVRQQCGVVCHAPSPACVIIS